MNSSYINEKINSINESNFSKTDIFLEIQNQLGNLEKNNNNLLGENERLINLNHVLQKENIELKSINESKENTIKEQILLLDNLKSKNEKLENQLLSYEKEKSDLNYAIIELNQKNKTLISNQNILLTSTNQKEFEEKVINLTQQLDSISINKSRLEYDNKLLVNKINQLQSTHENEINMMKAIQNSEIINQNKIITNLQKSLNNIQINTSNNINNTISNIQNKNIIYPHNLMDVILNFEKKTKMIIEDNIRLYSIVKELEKKIKIYEDNIERKEKYIKELKSNLTNVENNLKIKNEEIDQFYKDNFYQEGKFDKERNELINENNELKKSYEYCNTQIKEVNELFNKKMESFEILISNYQKKIQELEFQLLKSHQKNEILNLEIEKLKRKNKRYENNDINLNKKSTSQKSISLNSSGRNLFSNPIKLNNINNEQYITNTTSRNEYNPDNYTSKYQKLTKRRMNTIDYSNNNTNLEDPFDLMNYKSINDFRAMLKKVDKNLFSNYSEIYKVKDLKNKKK